MIIRELNGLSFFGTETISRERQDRQADRTAPIVFNSGGQAGPARVFQRNQHSREEAIPRSCHGWRT